MGEAGFIAGVAGKLRKADPRGKRILAGFDGFVDTLVRPVLKRYDPENYDPIPTLSEYGEMIRQAAGLSLNIEMVPEQRKLGGNGPILANSLIELGCSVIYIGALGKDDVSDVYANIRDRAERVVSISDPGQTDAVEFRDGKIISCKLAPLNDVTWTNLKKKLPPEEFAGILDECDAAAMVNWSLVNYMQTIWEGMFREVVPLMKNTERKKIFFDLADPEKRTREALSGAVGWMERFAERFDVTLGLNCREALQLAELRENRDMSGCEAAGIAAYLKKKIRIDRVLVHPVKEACGADGAGIVRVDGPYCPEPKLSTGAGDNFNAGFILGQLLGFGLKESLLIGTANSGFYVRNARSANYRELTEFVAGWGREEEEKE